jgi:hypothetical protein
MMTETLLFLFQTIAGTALALAAATAISVIIASIVLWYNDR